MRSVPKNFSIEKKNKMRSYEMIDNEMNNPEIFFVGLTESFRGCLMVHST